MVERTLNPINAKANHEFAVAEAEQTLNLKTPAPQLQHKPPIAQREKIVHLNPAHKNEGAETSKNVRPKSVRPKVTIDPNSQFAAGKRMVPIFPIDPNVKTLFGNIKVMYSERGLRAFVQGFSPTLFRQVANSVVQFTTYNFLRQLFHPNQDEQLPVYKGLAAGALSGAAVVAATQPIDVVKTRMQSTNARAVYRSTPRAFYKIFVEEGTPSLWAGAFPRYIKICTGSALTFGVYEIVCDMLKVAVQEKPFSSS